MEVQRADSIHLEKLNKTQHKKRTKTEQIKGFFNSHKLCLRSVGQNYFGLALIEMLTVTYKH